MLTGGLHEGAIGDSSFRLFRKPFVQDCADGEISHLVTWIYEHDIAISKTKLSENLRSPKTDSSTLLS